MRTAPRALLLASLLGVSAAFFESRRAYHARVEALQHGRDAVARRHVGAPPPDQYFNQTLDHFDVDGGPSWAQRYWANAAHWNGTGPVFVYLCGEAAGSPYDVAGGQHYDLGVPYGALFLALEHRFYGASLPASLPDLSSASLRFLSSHQALGDLATFLVQGAAVQFGFDPYTTPIAAFGGSYPGVLAAHARLRLPHLIDLSVASSAPVESQPDYWGYNDVVGRSLGSGDVGGSPACVASVAAAYAQVAQAFNGTADQRHGMAARLHNCGGLDGANDTAFAVSEYSNMMKGIVQGNGQWWMPDSISQICGNMTAEGVAPLDSLVSWTTAWLAAHNAGGCYSTSYSGEVAYVSNTEKAAWTTDQYRQWLWQLCSQYGQAQTCDAGTACPFSALYPNALSNLVTCGDVYGAAISPPLVAGRVAFTNAYTGGRALRATRVVYVNGAVDPWHAAGRWNATDDPTQPSVFIPGASHCRDMISAGADDPPPVVQAHAQIKAHVAVFLAQAGGGEGGGVASSAGNSAEAAAVAAYA